MVEWTNNKSTGFSAVEFGFWEKTWKENELFSEKRKENVVKICYTIQLFDFVFNFKFC